MSDERDEVESTHSFLELNLAHDSQEEDGNAGGDRNAESVNFSHNLYTFTHLCFIIESCIAQWQAVK